MILSKYYLEWYYPITLNCTTNALPLETSRSPATVFVKSRKTERTSHWTSSANGWAQSKKYLIPSCPMLRVRLSARVDIVAAQRAIAAISDAFVPLRPAPMIDRLVEGHEALRELVIAFGATGYLALYCFEPP